MGQDQVASALLLKFQHKSSVWLYKDSLFIAQFWQQEGKEGREFHL